MRSWLVAVASIVVGCDGGTGALDAATVDAGAADAALIDGAPVDAGRDLSSDRARFFGASRCAAADARLCEDFEAGAIDPARWSVNGTAPVVDTVHAARGTHALHVHRTGNGLSYLKHTSLFPALADGYYARAFVYFTQVPQAPMTYAHWTAFASTTAIGELRLGGQLQSGRNLWGVGTDSGSQAGGTGDWTTNDRDPDGAPRTVPVGEWLCIEWHHDSAADQTTFWWDAVEHPSLHTTASMHGGNANPYTLPAITGVWFGWHEYQASTLELELWLDELVIDDARVGCVI